MTIVSVAELQRAWQDVRDGRFRGPGGDRLGRGRPKPSDLGHRTWVPEAPVVPVLGCHGSAGCTTVAVAFAEACAAPVRVVEASPAAWSGLTGFATAELGLTGTGWVRGRRGQVVLDRLSEGDTSPDQVPVPDPDPPEGLGLNVLDTGWDAHAILACPGWLRSTVVDADVLLLVTTATVPGLRRLEAVLHELDSPPAVVVAVRGPALRRWPRQVASSVGPRTRVLLPEAMVQMPHDPAFAVRGLDTTGLPASVLAAATSLTHLIGPGCVPGHYPKGTTHAR